MSKAQQAFDLSITINTTLDNKLKQIFRLISQDDCYLAFKDGSFLHYQHDKNTYRGDKLRVVSQAPF